MRRERSLLVPYTFLGIATVISVFPFLWTIFASTHTNSQVFQLGDTLKVGNNFIANYIGLTAFSPIWNNMFNSIFISGIFTIAVLIIDSMAGFAFAKYKFKGRDALFFVCIASMFIPQQVTMVPLFIQLSKFNMMDSSSAIILPALAAVFGVFLMRQNFMAFPNELIEASRIDGASDFRTFFTIVVPAMKPAFASLGILSFVNQWGNFMWPLIVLNTKSHFTMPLVLSLMVQPGQVVNYGAVMVGGVLALIPVLTFFLIFQKNFIEGMLSGAVKGKCQLV